jgi:prefoldin subunit 5
MVSQVWWLGLLLAALTGLVLWGMFQTLRAQKALRAEQALQAEADAAHRRGLAEQDRWLEAHRDVLEAEIARLRDDAGQVDQALGQQVRALERQMGGERAAHWREVQALRWQCDELSGLLAAARTDLLSIRTAPACERLGGEADAYLQACPACDVLREEVNNLRALLDHSDTAQAALQHRANVLEQQMATGQRQLEALRHGRPCAPIPLPLMCPVA